MEEECLLTVDRLYHSFTFSLWTNDPRDLRAVLHEGLRASRLNVRSVHELLATRLKGKSVFESAALLQDNWFGLDATLIEQFNADINSADPNGSLVWWLNRFFSVLKNRDLVWVATPDDQISESLRVFAMVLNARHVENYLRASRNRIEHVILAPRRVRIERVGHKLQAGKDESCVMIPILCLTAPATTGRRDSGWRISITSVFVIPGATDGSSTRGFQLARVADYIDGAADAFVTDAEPESSGFQYLATFTHR